MERRQPPELKILVRIRVGSRLFIAIFVTAFVILYIYFILFFIDFVTKTGAGTNKPETLGSANKPGLQVQNMGSWHRFNTGQDFPISWNFPYFWPLFCVGPWLC